MHVQFSKVISHRPGVPFWYYVSLTMYLNAPVVINSDSFRPPCVDPRKDGGGLKIEPISSTLCKHTPYRLPWRQSDVKVNSNSKKRNCSGAVLSEKN